MIRSETISSIIDLTDDGKLLVAAIAILTSLDKQDIDEHKWGGMVHPDDAFKQIVDLANQIYYADEYESERKMNERDSKLDKLIN